eukprot:CAMPEP_0178909566 /NCGR_PEP_ID=MMETSP0786-20121207/8596_1 /TAXON_ID=186022 /ORGANISM="Thalassionema frauenfeldii, Strain CCMP 1798" /LENGTH=61 /DNA_ID=CAMNT_0020581687 /DNA_START=73 /DNA_END=258 /DNA_ORIENTATION=+
MVKTIGAVEKWSMLLGAIRTHRLLAIVAYLGLQATIGTKQAIFTACAKLQTGFVVIVTASA